MKEPSVWDSVKNCLSYVFAAAQVLSSRKTPKHFLPLPTPKIIPLQQALLESSTFQNPIGDRKSYSTCF